MSNMRLAFLERFKLQIISQRQSALISIAALFFSSLYTASYSHRFVSSCKLIRKQFAQTPPICLTIDSMNKVAKIRSVAPVGFAGHMIDVESDMTKGLPALQIVGLGNKAIDEARERVRSAITNSLLEYPAQRITINLAPAELPKDGTHYDLPIALALLTSSGQLRPEQVAGAVFAGELALDGTLRPVKGAITIAEAARDNNYNTVYLPTENLAQASLVSGVTLYGVPDLTTLFLHLKGEKLLPIYQPPPTDDKPTTPASSPLLDDIYGQAQAKRALTIAAAGHHNILFTGPPGTGKSMLAKTLPSLLPPLTPDEQLAVTKLHSLAGLSLDQSVQARPFRAPHHTASRASLIGGGSVPQPGEVSLAHLGVLFLDELPEYPRTTLEVLRQPLEDTTVTVTRARGRATYPADFMLVATMNPCPCGYYGDPTHACTCSSTQIIAYQKRLSGPLMDRIDMIIPVNRIPNEQLLSHRTTTDHEQRHAIATISTAIHAQAARYGGSAMRNSRLSSAQVRRSIPLSPEVKQFLDAASTKLGLSPRGYFKVIKVAQTIADLDEAPHITIAHISEALQYRQPAPIKAL